MATKKYTAEETRERKNARQREYAKRTGRAADNKYKKEKTKMYALRMFLNTEADIIEWLESKENKTGYIKQLIREDIKRKVMHNGNEELHGGRSSRTEEHKTKSI